MYDYNKSKKLNNGLREFITDFNGDYAVTAVFNRDVSIDGAKANIKDWYAKVSRKLYGKKWGKKDAWERLQFIAVVEHTESNLHFHFVVKLGGGRKDWKFKIFAKYLWTKFNKSGGMVVDKIATAEQNEKIGIYFTKETWKATNFGNFILSDGF